MLNDMCQNCHKYKATDNWVGNGGVLDYVHGMYARWCKRCVLKEQIKTCKKAVRRLPGLEKQLAKLNGKTN